MTGPARRPPSRATAPSKPASRRDRARSTTRAAPTADPEALAALEEDRRFLLDSLRDLEGEREAGEIDEDDYTTLRDDYTARAATVLRQIEAARRPARPLRRPKGQGGGGQPAAATGESRPRRRRRRTALTLALVVGLASVAGVGVAAFSGPRVGGQSSTGRDLSGPAGRLAEAHALETEGKAADALKLYDAVLEEDPANVEALTYKGWLLARAGLTDPALTALDQAVALNPNYPDAHFFRGMVLYQSRNDPAGAVVEFEAFLANNPPPDSVPAVREVLERARRDAGTAGPPPG